MDTYKHFISVCDSIQPEKQTLTKLPARLHIEEQRTQNREEVAALVMKQKRWRWESRFKKIF